MKARKILNSWQFWIVTGYALLAVGFGFGFYESHQRAQKNRETICLLGRLFGLDRPVPPEQLRRLRPTQRKALTDLVEACPGLTKGKPGVSP